MNNLDDMNNDTCSNGCINGDNNILDDGIIRPKARFIRKNIKSLYLDPSNLDFDSFYNLVKSSFTVNIGHSVLFKIRYNGDRFGMLAPQEGIRLIGDEAVDIKSIDKLFTNLCERLNEFINRKEYDVECVDLIQALYVTVADIPELKLKGINNIKLNKEFVKVKSEKFSFSSNIMPLSVNLSYYGVLVMGSDRIKYLDLINNDKIILGQKIKVLQDLSSMYLYNNTYIILSKNVSDTVITREVYDVNTGKLIAMFTDNILSKYMFTRKRGDLVLTIEKDKVISLMARKSLGILKYRPTEFSDSAYSLIGSLDLEAYDDSDGSSKVYAIGYNVLGEKPEVFYINESNNSDELVLKCFDYILQPKHDKYIFYCHNFSGYDSIFILKILKEANIKKGYDYYDLKPLYRDGGMLKLDIKIRRVLSDRKQGKIGVRKEPGFIKITIVDSYALLNKSLYELSRSFDIEVSKSHFPHTFVKKDTLNYKGKTPSLVYWLNVVDKVNNISKKEYKELYSDNWNLKHECIKYLGKDLISLLAIMDTFNKYIYRLYDIQMTKCVTISRLALNIFLKNYLKNSCLPVIRSNMYRDIKEAYFGGITEVYKPYGKDLFYYDVNSLYPYSALNSMPGNKCSYIEDLDSRGLNLNDLFGFFYCEIETDDSYLGLLPVRHPKGITMPQGKWCGWYFSEELKFAAANKWKIKVVKGYNFNKVDNVFDKYVTDLYEIKRTKTGHMVAIAKPLLNNLLGRLGLDVTKPISKIVKKIELDELISTRVFSSLPISITEHDYLITYYPDISREVCESHGLDYVKVYSSWLGPNDMEYNKEFNDVSLTTAAAVTSYGRLYMSKLKLDILSKGGNIYYTDTDSIVTDIPLDSNIVGDKLGQFKLVGEVKEGFFITSKTYCLVYKDKKKDIHIAIKGGSKGSLNKNDFIKMNKGQDVEALKRITVTNKEEGYVLIANKKINLNADAYEKREKVYSGGKWVDTTPLRYDQLFNK